VIYNKKLALQKIDAQIEIPVGKSGIYTINDKYRKDYFWIIPFSILILNF
jgi:hypothetical protein